MNNGNTNAFYIVATILVLLSLSLAMKGVVSADHFEAARQSLSTALSGIAVPGAHAQSSLYDTYCFVHNQYFGLRF